MSEKKELVTMDQAQSLAAVFGGVGENYFSGQVKTPEDKKRLFNAMNNPDFRLADAVNTVIAVKDLYVEKVEMVNQETGEVKECPRVVLIDAEGKSYGCVSFGILGSLKKIMAIYGQPTWEEPVTVKPVFINKANDRRILSLQMV